MTDLNWITDHTREHGIAMYLQGLQHAVNMFEIAGEDALPKLKERLAEEEAALKELRGE